MNENEVILGHFEEKIKRTHVIGAFIILKVLSCQDMLRSQDKSAQDMNYCHQKANIKSSLLLRKALYES